MAIPIKNKAQIEEMRAASRLVLETHELLANYIKVGTTTLELDRLAYDFIVSKGAKPNFLHYNDYPNSICASINEVVIHGIPNKRKIKDGDIVSIDLGVVLNGWHGDAARTILVGDVSDEAKKLERVTRESFFEGIKFAKAGNHLHDISKAIENFVTSNGYSVVKEYVGHGIGRILHEAPQVPNYFSKGAGRGPRLRAGMTLAIEPMVNAGKSDITHLDDGWTVLTVDNSLSAHYENTILITDGEPEILTMR